MLEKLNAVSADVADATDVIMEGMSRGYEAMRKLNDLQSSVQHLIAITIKEIRHSAETIPVELQNPHIAEIEKSNEMDPASQHGPQAQDSRETVAPPGELVGGVGDGTDAGEAPQDETAAQSVQAVAETAPVKPGAAPDASATDRVLDLWQTGELTAHEITEQTFLGSSVVIKILRKARGIGDPRVVRGDLRKAEHAAALDREAQAREAEILEAETRNAASVPDDAPAAPAEAAEAAAEPPADAPDGVGTVLEVHPSRVRTTCPEASAIGSDLAFVSVREGLVENGGEELRLSGAPLRVIAKLNNQRVYTEEELTTAGRYVSATVFRRNLHDIQRCLARVGLHIVEFVGGGFQLRRVAP